MIKKQLISLLLFSSFMFQACLPIEKEKEYPTVESGSWLMKMQLKGAVLPFSFELIEKEGDYSIKITNTDEEILLDEVSVYKDSIEFNMPVFESSFFLKVNSSDSLSGVWVNYYKSDDYIIDVWAVRSDELRFADRSTADQKAPKLRSKYEVEFSPNEDDAYPAIGLFELKDDLVSGTFATETGDYRYLEGRVAGDSLFLSTFDGSHAFYFSAAVKDSTLEGVFLSGIHHKENWIAKYNPDFELRDPDSLTTLIDSSAISFRLPNTDGELVSIDGPEYKGKVKIVQIMGSWCPNCLDESRYFNQLYDQYAADGLEIIGLAFERTRSEARAIQNLQKFVSKEGISYPVLLGGYNRDQQHPKDVFPMLDKIMSYPTTLFLDKQNQVRKIHTGFYGPGTGKYFDEYKSETQSFLELLLKET
jgi:thiol-disulfide isomerase/thioredoxin